MTELERDRRRHTRFHCGGEAEVRSLSSGIVARGKIANLSLGGCCIEVGISHSFRKDEAAEMTFSVRQFPLRVQGVIRQAHCGQALGVEFTMLSERGKRQLQELIQELAEILKEQITAAR